MTISPRALANQRTRRIGAATVAVFLSVATGVMAPLKASATVLTAGSTISFAYTGAEQSLVVPAGATLMRVTATGGAGLGTYPSVPAIEQKPGGNGARLSADLPAPTSGTTVFVEVGGNATFNGGNASSTGGFNGGGASVNGAGGGGGATDLRTVGRANDRAVNDGITSSSTTVTSVTAAFTGADVGAPIMSSDLPAGTTIVTVVNATTITVSQTATGTHTGQTLVIRASLASRIVVAGGGGGAGWPGSDTNNQCPLYWGTYGVPVCRPGAGGGGVTGSFSGGNGATAEDNLIYVGSYPNTVGGQGGGGATGVAGGAGGQPHACSGYCYGAGGSAGSAGTLGQGGAGSPIVCTSLAPGGGGGGGYYGGGGAAGGNGYGCPYAYAGGGGGGAGSSYAEPSALSSSVAADATRIPQVTVTFNPTTTSVSCLPNPTPVASASTCTVTVANVDSTDAVAATGTVSWGIVTGSGSLGSSSCLLDAGGACSVTYTPPGGSEGTHTLSASYPGDSAHSPSSGNGNVTAGKRATSTAVSCSPASAPVNASMPCTATVTDTDAGIPSTPTGTVTWSTSAGSGSFVGTTCGLSSGSCSSNFTPAPGHVGPLTVSASYGGDTDHLTSNGSTGVTATVRTTSLGVSCVPSSDPVNAASTCTATVSDTDTGTALTATGTVNWAVNAGPGSLGATSCLLSGGACSVSYTPALGSEGAHSLQATYAGDADHSGSTQSGGLTATTRATSLAASCSPSTDPVNATTTCTATATDTAAGTSTVPTGNVAWTVTTGSGTLGAPSCALSVGTCSVTYTPSAGSAGNHILHAAYVGDTDHAGSAGDAPVTVALRSTAVSMGCSANSAPVNTTVNCVANVTDTATGTSSTPTGTVQWGTAGGRGSFSAPTCTLLGGFCFITFTPDPGSEGATFVRAVYHGDTDHATSFNQYAFTVNRRGTSVAAGCAPPSLPVNAPSTCTATVSDTGAGTTIVPGGTISWSVTPASGSFSPPSCVLSSGSCSTTYTPAPGSEGPQSLHAAYGGDTDHASSGVDTSVTGTVRSRTMAASCLPSPDPVNSPATCTATVTDTDTGSPVVPTGTVNWTITTGSGSFATASCSLLAGSCSVAYTPALGSEGAHSLVASYVGDVNFNAATASAPLTVGKRSTATVAWCAPATDPVNVATTCTATVSDTASGTTTTPAGTVMWTVTTGSGSFSSPSCALSSGTCAVTYTPNPGSAGAQVLHAVYSGETDHAVSAGNAPLTVVKRTTSVTDLCTASSGHTNAPVTCIASVNDTGPGGIATTPTGTVSWSLASGAGSFSAPTCTLSGGVCTIIYTPATGSEGPQSVKAVYNGDADHSSSNNAFPFTVTTVPVVLDAYGGLHPADGATINMVGAPYWAGWKIARGVVILPAETGGYTLDGYGGIHAWGAAPTRGMNDGSNWSGFDIARSIALNPCDATGHSGYVLDGYGGIHAFGAAPAVTGSAYWGGWDIAKALALNPCSGGVVSGYVLDGYGGLHGFSSGAPIANPGSATWPGWNIARAVVVTSAGRGYTLDGYGGLHAFGGAPAMIPAPAYFGWDIARGVTLLANGTGGYVIDGYGGIHAFGSAASLNNAPGAYWPGQDIARAAGTGF